MHAGSQQLLEGMVALNAMMLDTVAPDGTPEAVSQQQLVAASKALRYGVAALTRAATGSSMSIQSRMSSPAAQNHQPQARGGANMSNQVHTCTV